MADYMTSYQAYETEDDESPDQFLINEDEAPVHVHSHGNGSTARWNHIENLDDFFQRVYHYHQRHGFFCMIVEDILQLLQFLFIILFTGFLIDCVDYDVLFATRTPDTKQTFQHVIKTPCKCGFSRPAAAICMLIALSFLLIRTLKFFYNLFKYYEMKQFYQIALQVNSGELENKTWSEVQDKLMQAQRDLQMCIHKNELTHLDIYHRLLRFKNYFIAMVNKGVVPYKYKLPLVGEFWYLSHSLKFNLEYLLFWGPCNISPWENDWHVKPEFKNLHKRVELSQRLSKNILIVGVVNLLLSPLILLWQILYMFFVYGELLKREPKFLGSRKWSLFSRTYLRHFNELDHELNSRLNRAYDCSNEYLSGFTSPILTVIAKSVTFFSGSVLVVLVCLTVYDEDTLQIEHMLTLMTGCGVLMTVSRVFIPPEHYVFCPETLMVNILSNIHYQPDEWKDKAHTSQVQQDFSQLFQLKAGFLLGELFSPLLTPLILIFYVRPKALDIVDFYRNFTVDVLGVGDVCSFAQLDVKKHGSPKWSTPGAAHENPYLQSENGKTELSLMHFALTNPTWKPPKESNNYLTELRDRAVRDVNQGSTILDSPLGTSLHALSMPMHSMSLSQMNRTSMMRSSYALGGRRKPIIGSLSNHEGPLTEQPVCGGIVEALSQSGSFSGFSDLTNSEYVSNEISLSVLYMHELKKRNQLANIGYENIESVRQVMSSTSSDLPRAAIHSINEEEEEDDPHSLLTQSSSSSLRT